MRPRRPLCRPTTARHAARLAALACGVLVVGACQHAVPTLPATASADSGPWAEGWQPFILPGKTATVYTPRLSDGRWSLHAQSQQSASMYRRALRIEPAQLGTMSFSWKAASLPADADVRESETEDAVVRVLLAFDGEHGRLSPRTRMMFDLMHGLTGETPPYATLMYVWDGRAEVGSVVLNQRSDRIRKIVLESGAARLGQWQSYERDVRADYRRAFGEDPGTLIGVAVMTDSDNTRSQAEAWYGEIRFQ